SIHRCIRCVVCDSGFRLHRVAIVVIAYPLYGPGAVGLRPVIGEPARLEFRQHVTWIAAGMAVDDQPIGAIGNAKRRAAIAAPLAVAWHGTLAKVPVAVLMAAKRARHVRSSHGRMNSRLMGVG